MNRYFISIMQLPKLAVSPENNPVIPDLTPEEAYLWRCACSWRKPVLPEASDALDWDRLVEIGLTNKMATLLDQVLDAVQGSRFLSTSAWEALQAGRERAEKKAAELTAVLQRFMPLAAQAQLEVMPLKGLWVSHHLYQNPAVRPGHDLDMLVARDRVNDAIALLEQIGFGRYWPDSLADEFYKRHHLHLELSLSDCWTWVEVHWAFDHPRTLLTIDYQDVLARSTAGELLGVPVRDPNPVDLLLYLCVHLVKHMIHLPVTYSAAEIQRLILAEGRLMLFLDVAEAIKRFEHELDWALLTEIARRYGAIDILGSVLQVCCTYLAAPVPAWVLSELCVSKHSRLRQHLWHKMAAHSLEEYSGSQTNGMWRYLMAENFQFVFRPIRLLDFWRYAFPKPHYLERRYGRYLGMGGVHLAKALVDYARLGLDTFYYLWQRKRGAVPIFVTRDDSIPKI